MRQLKTTGIYHLTVLLVRRPIMLIDLPRFHKAEMEVLVWLDFYLETLKESTSLPSHSHSSCWQNSLPEGCGSDDTVPFLDCWPGLASSASRGSWPLCPYSKPLLHSREALEGYWWNTLASLDSPGLWLLEGSLWLFSFRPVWLQWISPTTLYFTVS